MLYIIASNKIGQKKLTATFIRTGWWSTLPDIHGGQQHSFRTIMDQSKCQCITISH